MPSGEVSARRRPPQSYANLGKGFQIAIDHTCARYRNAKLGKVRRLPERVVRLSRSKRGEKLSEARYIPCKGLIDYAGSYCGIPCAFDAKEATGDYLSRDCVPEHQVYELLEEVVCGGGCGFLLVWTGSRSNVLAVHIWWWMATLADRAAVPVREMHAAAAGAPFDRGVVPIVPGAGAAPCDFGPAMAELHQWQMSSPQAQAMAQAAGDPTGPRPLYKRPKGGHRK